MRPAARVFLTLASLVVAAALFAGFVIIPSPAMQRIYDLDSRRLDELDTLASATNVYVIKTGALPKTLGDLTSEVMWAKDAARDPLTRRDYDYIPGQDLAYKLCAVFGAPSQKGATGFAVHPEGRSCEARMAIRKPPP